VGFGPYDVGFESIQEYGNNERVCEQEDGGWWPVSPLADSVMRRSDNGEARNEQVKDVDGNMKCLLQLFSRQELRMAHVMCARNSLWLGAANDRDEG